MPDDASGIHSHPDLKLGKAKPANKPTLKVGDFLRVAEIPAHPLEVPDVPYLYPMDRNDQAGVCVVASVDHALQTISMDLGVPRGNWSDQQILQFYQTQNPNFNSWSDGGTNADGGMIVQDFLNYLVKNTDYIVAFGAIDFKNADLYRASIWLGQAIVTGSMLQVAQQSQFDRTGVFDYVARSGEWGGHAMATYAYNAGDIRANTWTKHIELTNNFVTHQMDEAWLVITSAHINNPQFRNNFDLAGFADAIRELTNGKVVIPTPPVPNPVPVPPTPTPAPPLPDNPMNDFPADAVRHWLPTRDHTKAEMRAKQAMSDWMQRHRL